MRHRLLTQEEDFVDVLVLAGAGADARIDLSELGHDREHLFLDNLRGVSLPGKIGLIGA